MKGAAFVVCVGSILMSGAASATDNGQADDSELQCRDCPPFVKVPNPPGSLRNIEYVAQYELTWRDYLEAVDDGSCRLPIALESGEPLSADDLKRFRINWTVTVLSLSDVECYRAWLQRQVGDRFEIAVPTPEEWEWFARGGAKTAYPWGNDADASKAALSETAKTLPSWSPFPFSYGVRLPEHSPSWVLCGPVGQFEANRFRLFDVIGLHNELTSKSLDAYEYRLAQGRSIEAYQGRRVYALRGGSCLNEIEDVSLGSEVFAITGRNDNRLSASFAVRFIAIENMP